VQNIRLGLAAEAAVAYSATRESLRRPAREIYAAAVRVEAPMAKLKTTVNKSKCIASEDCISTAPGVFQMGDDDKAEVYNPTGASDDVIFAAARACPAKAILVVDEETGNQVWPPRKI
jgi:ferredoxin